MTKKLINEERTLENAFTDDFEPKDVDKWVEDIIGEINWEEDSSTDDEDVIRNFDEELSTHSIDRDYINLMTKKFIDEGGEVKVIPTTYKSGLNPCNYLYKTTNSDSNPFEWSEEKEYARFHRIPQRLCPYNIYRKYVELEKVKLHSRKEETPYIPLNA